LILVEELHGYRARQDYLTLALSLI